jgi:hypothetical protein
MSNSPTISVVLPTYNAAATIRTALDSVYSQDYSDFEVLVVDDASRDDTIRVATAYGGRAQRVMRLERNRGPAGARNAGIEGARGEWVAFLDGDDAWLPWRLSSQMAVAAVHPDGDLLCGEVRIMGEASGGTLKEPGGGVRQIAVEEFIDENPVPTSTVLARKAAILRAGGFDERFRGPEDIDLWMRLVSQGAGYKVCKPLALYREKPGSLSMDQDRFLPNILAVYDKAFAPGGALAAYGHLKRRALAGRYVSSCWSYLVCGQRAKALGLLLRSWRLHPGRLRVERTRPAWRLIMLANIVLNRRGNR